MDEKREIKTIDEAYNPAFVVERVLKYSIPYIIIYFIEVILNICIDDYYNFETTTNNILTLFYDFLSGGFGPGSYYYPCLIQFILIFPIIYFIVKRKGKRSLTFFFLTNFLYEVLKCAYDMNEELYRLLVFRYIFLIAAGCYLFFENNITQHFLDTIIIMFFGVLYIVMVAYLECDIPIITYWRSTSFVVGLFIIPLIAFGLEGLNNVRCSPLEKLGKASFEIFLIQMIYYYYIYDRINSNLMVPRVLLLIISIGTCSIVGICFHYIVTLLDKHIETKIFCWLKHFC